MAQFKLTRGRHFYHSEMSKHHFTVENDWHTAPAQGGGPCHREWERPVECPLIWCTKINESILWMTWQASAMWISWSNIMTTCLWMLQNHWPVVFHVVRCESQWKEVDLSGNSHSVATVVNWSWGFCQSLTILPLLSPSGLHISVLNSLLLSNIPKWDRLIWNQLQWNTSLTSNGPWCLLIFYFFNTLNLYFQLMLMTLELLQFQNGATILRKNARGINHKEICKPFPSLWRTSATLHHLVWVEQEEAASHLTS